MLAGPSVVTCFNSDENMGVCLRGKMADAGLVPQPATAVAEVEAPAPAEEPAVTPEPVLATPPAASEPEPASEPAAPADDLVAATFGLLRAEPDGSVVIAGSGTPGTEVEVYSNGSLLGSATVESSGDWVLVPDAPIPPGGTEITLGEAGKTGRAEQSFVVAINEDKTSEPLVVASTPGAASDILQGIDRPPAGTTTELAAADPVTPPPVEPPAATPTPEAKATEPVAAPTTPPEAPDQSADAAPPAPTSEPPVAPTEPATTPEEPAATTDATPAQPEEPAVTQQPATPTDDPTVPADEPAVRTAPTESSIAIAPTTPAAPAAAAMSAAPAAPTLAGPPPTIDAIEIEGDRTFFAGGGPEGATMRLYVDDTFIADAEVTDGRWLVEAGPVLDKPSQRIRIDMLQPGTAQVAARAEVDFVVELPAGEPPVAVAQADDPAPAPAVAEPAAPEAAPSTAGPAPQQPATASAQPATPAAPAAPAPQPPIASPAPAASAEQPVEPAAAPVQPAAEPAEPATQQPAAPASEPAAPTEPPPQQPAAPAAPAVVEPEPIAEEEPVPTMVAVAVGDPEAQRFASGKAIIRRGDNLWTIARRVYGQGIRYTTIYEANSGQIRDPDDIYPGQVFELPKAAN